MPRYNGTCKTCGAPVKGHAEYCQACRRAKDRELAREWARRKREEKRIRAPFRPCTDCGRLLIPAGTNRQLCDECRAEHRRARSARMTYGTANEARRAVGLAAYKGRPPKGRRVEDIVKAAAKEGLSYGQYVQRYGL